MLRTALIAAIATCVGGAASPIRMELLERPAATAILAEAAAPAPRTAKPHHKHGLRLDRSADGLFHAPMLINGQHTSLIVDTGATVTVLTRADAARLGIDQAILPGAAKLRTAGGQSAMKWAVIKSARFAGRELADLQVAIVEQGLEHSLLGQDVLSAGGVLRLEGEAMEIS